MLHRVPVPTVPPSSSPSPICKSTSCKAQLYSKRTSLVYLLLISFLLLMFYFSAERLLYISYEEGALARALDGWNSCFIRATSNDELHQSASSGQSLFAGSSSELSKIATGDVLVNASGTENEGHNMTSGEAVFSSNKIHGHGHRYIDTVRGRCTNRLIYTYPLPREFNEELIERCNVGYKKFCDKWFCIPCNRIENNGFGPPVPNLAESGTQRITGRISRESGRTVVTDDSVRLELVPSNAWFRSDQFSSEIIFYEKMKVYECATRNPDEASAFYIPYLGGLDMAFTLFSRDANVIDALQQRLIGWLQRSSVWQRKRQSPHLMVLGHVAWDFDREPLEGQGGDEGRSFTWGSSLFRQLIFQNVTRLLVERKPSQHDMGLPFPTLFHPSTPTDISLWQEQLRKSRRSWFVTFVGGSRRRFSNKGIRNVRQILMMQCHEQQNQTIRLAKNTLQRCKKFECVRPWEMTDKRLSAELGRSEGEAEISCDEEPEEVVRALAKSVFCLQPKGDSATRKGLFDSIIAGCIPVLFANETAYLQYQWHLPPDPASYSVYIPETDLATEKGTTTNVITLLSQLPYTRIKHMQRNIRNLIPRVVYSPPGSTQLAQDAFSIALHSFLRQSLSSPN
ncbi:hypothetical protein KP509_1Z207600 [Ceratopteris richardii]|nr:hypothetical protein KP509_1Z207600 [Ceratopteris richardii]